MSLCVIFIKSILVNMETLVKRAQCLKVMAKIKVVALFARKGSLDHTPSHRKYTIILLQFPGHPHVLITPDLFRLVL